MTKLNDIKKNHLVVYCENCEHYAILSVEELLNKYSQNTEISELLSKFRCKKCLLKGSASINIIFIGNSSKALDGARTH
jgi:aerobic-type carbon monoxide dehydrogenase small subunit (CoxS/CutS family)